MSLRIAAASSWTALYKDVKVSEMRIETLRTQATNASQKQCC